MVWSSWSISSCFSSESANLPASSPLFQRGGRLLLLSHLRLFALFQSTESLESFAPRLRLSQDPANVDDGDLRRTGSDLLASQAAAAPPTPNQSAQASTPARPNDSPVDSIHDFPSR